MLATAFLSTANAVETSTSRAVRSRNWDSLSARFDEAKIRVLEAKEHLFFEGDPATHVYRVETGHLIIFRAMADGRRQVIDFAYPGDFVGLGAIGEHGNHALATSRTLVRCLPVPVLTELAQNNPAMGFRLYEAVSRELIASRELLFTVSQRTACERLAAFLVALSRRNVRRGEAADEIVLPMNRSDIADFLGLTIETVSRTFTRFRTECLIDVEHCILVTIRDAQRLQAMAGGEGTSRRH